MYLQKYAHILLLSLLLLSLYDYIKILNNNLRNYTEKERYRKKNRRQQQQQQVILLIHIRKEMKN